MSGLRPFPAAASADAFDVAAEVSGYQTPLGDYLGAQFGEGAWSSGPGQVVANMRVPDAMPTDDELAVRSRMSGVPIEQIRANRLRVDTPAAPAPITMAEDEWAASAWHRPGLTWDRRMTEPRAQALARIHDENAYRRWLIEQSPSGLRSIAGFGAALLGGAPDPVNYIPVFGPAARAAAAARFGRMLGPNAAKVAGAATVQGAEAMIGTAAVEPVLLPSRRQFGDDVGFADAVMDVAFSGLFGAAFGGGAAGWRAYKDRGLVHDVPAQEVGARLLAHAATDVAQGAAPNLHALMDGLHEQVGQLRRAVRDVEASPIGDPMDPLVEPASRDEVPHPLTDTAAPSAQPGSRGQAGAPAPINISLSGAARTTDVAITATGREVRVVYEVVEASTLITSHGDDLQVNPAYPSGVQPRDRARPASAEQIGAIAADPRPALLGHSGSASDGAPIVGPDGVVESGNGRILGLRRAFARNPEGAARYRAWLERQSLDITDMREPVLVRRRLDDLGPEDRAAFAREANERSTLAMGAAERAQADAAALPDSLFDCWRGGDVGAVANRDFVRGWLTTLTQSDRGAVIDAQGSLSRQGVDRLQAALIARAYDDPHLVARLAESAENDSKTIGRVLTDLAPDWIRLRAAVREGRVSADMDQTAALMQAVALIRRARDTGMKVRDLADQMDLFAPRVDEVRSFLRLMYGDALGRAVGYEKLRVAFGRYVDQAMHNIAGPRLIGDPLSARQILDTVRQPRALDAMPAPDAKPDPEMKAAQDRAPRPAGDIDSMATDLGIDLKTGEFDEIVDFGQLERGGRLRPDEANAVREAEALMARADQYEGGYDAAAICQMRAA